MIIICLFNKYIYIYIYNIYISSTTTKAKPSSNDNIEDGKKKNFGVSLSKPKNLFARAMNRFGGGGSPRNQSHQQPQHQQPQHQQPQHQPQQQLGWELTNTNDNNITDDEDYIQ